MAGNLVTGWATVSFWRGILLHGLSQFDVFQNACLNTSELILWINWSWFVRLEVHCCYWRLLKWPCPEVDVGEQNEDVAPLNVAHKNTKSYCWAASQELPPSYRNLRFITVVTTSRQPVSILSQINPVHIHTPNESNNDSSINNNGWVAWFVIYCLV